MKTQTFIVAIQMPNADHIGDGYLQDEIEACCNGEDHDRYKVTVTEVKEMALSRDKVDEAAMEYSEEHNDECVDAIGENPCPFIISAFKAGAEWQKKQTLHDPEICKENGNSFTCKWSEEDEKMLNIVIDFFADSYDENDDEPFHETTYGKIVSWLKSLRNRKLM